MCAYYGVEALGLKALDPTGVGLRVTWLGAFGADRARGSAADLGDVCSIVAWPCPARSRGYCWLDRMLYTMVSCCKGRPCYIWKGGRPFIRTSPGAAWHSRMNSL